MDESETPEQIETPLEAEPAEARIALLEAQVAKTREDMLRALAEVENTRRRGERQLQDARTYAVDKFAGDLLAVADNLGRALQSMPDAASVDEATRTMIEGVAMTERSLLDVFARHGLKRTGAKGEAFDPAVHQAVTQIPSDAPAGAVAEVFQPGYKLGERTLRPAMVAVSAGAPAASPPPAEGAGEGKIDITV